MPVIQIDKNGFIKGTKRKLAMKVIIKKAMMIRGEFVPVGAILDLEGAFLAECLAYNKVEPCPEEVKVQEEELKKPLELKPELELKKLGPKKRTRKAKT